jgi:hypothetical protein
MNQDQDQQLLFDELTLALNGFNPDCLVPMKQIDDNWQKLKAEQSQPKLEVKDIKKIVNCKFKVWHDSNHQRLSAEYDAIYTDKTVLHRQLNGEFDNREAHVSDLKYALDSVLTMIARSGFSAKIRTTRLYVPNSVKEQSREINLIEIYDNDPIMAWFVYNNFVYPARLDETQPSYYAWILNSRRNMSLKEFDDFCWQKGTKK